MLTKILEIIENFSENFKRIKQLVLKLDQNLYGNTDEKINCPIFVPYICGFITIEPVEYCTTEDNFFLFLIMFETIPTPLFHKHNEFERKAFLLLV